jgi:hypothetical protein
VGTVPDDPKPLPHKRQLFVGFYVGESKGNATDAARRAGYKNASEEGYRLLRNDQVKAAIEGHRAAIRRQGIAVQQNRVDALVRRHQLLERVIEERAAEYRALAEERAADPGAGSDLDALVGRRSIPAGGETGLLVRKVKMVGTLIAEEFAVDTGLLAELRAHENDIAKELGERVERQDVTHGGNPDFLAVLREFGRGRAGA